MRPTSVWERRVCSVSNLCLNSRSYGPADETEKTVRRNVMHLWWKPDKTSRKVLLLVGRWFLYMFAPSDLEASQEWCKERMIYSPVSPPCSLRNNNTDIPLTFHLLLLEEKRNLWWHWHRNLAIVKGILSAIVILNSRERKNWGDFPRAYFLYTQA